MNSVLHVKERRILEQKRFRSALSLHSSPKVFHLLHTLQVSNVYDSKGFGNNRFSTEKVFFKSVLLSKIDVLMFVCFITRICYFILGLVRISEPRKNCTSVQ